MTELTTKQQCHPHATNIFIYAAHVCNILRIREYANKKLFATALSMLLLSHVKSGFESKCDFTRLCNSAIFTNMNLCKHTVISNMKLSLASF